MYTLRPITQSFFIVLALLCVTPAFFGQTHGSTAPEPSYQAVLQVVIGQMDAPARGELPQNLSGVSKQLRENFPFSGYRLANTFIGRIATAGSLEYKSVSDIFGQTSETDAPTFLEFNLGRLSISSDERGQTVLLAQPFRFGARVPIRVSRSKTPDAPASDVLNYESVGLNMNRISVPENKPTLVGTLSLPKAAGTMFLVLTVRPAEN